MEDYIYKKICNVLDELIEQGKKDFAIYPFGKRGMELKEILNNRYGIRELYIADNGLVGKINNDNIISVNELGNKLEKDMTVLLASDSEENYQDIRTKLYDSIPFTQVVDVLSRSLFYDERMYGEQPVAGHPRIGTLEMAAREIIKNKIGGALAEVGVYRGDFSKEIVRFLPGRKLYLFDTFEGFDERDIKSGDEYIVDFQNNVETFKDTSVSMAVNNIGQWNDIEVRKGYFPETACGLDAERFAFVSLDTDLYEPIKAGLNFFWDKMSPGGYIFVHDYGWGRVGDAVREFASEVHTGFVPITDWCHSVIFVKPY